MEEALLAADDALLATLAPLIEIGVNHEQQHQELMLTDILHAFSLNPVSPAYDSSVAMAGLEAQRRRTSIWRKAFTPSATTTTATASTTSGRRIARWSAR